MNKLSTSVCILAMLTAFDNSAKWKIDADGKIETKDGNPILVDASGAEKTMGIDTINRLNSEAKEHRIGKEKAEEKLLAFKDIDPTKAKEALEKLSKLGAKELIDSGEVERLKEQIKGEFTAQLTEKDGALNTATDRINKMLVDNMFSGSDFVRNGLMIPKDFFQSNFRENFKVEDGKVIAYDKAGNRLMSKERVGEYAEGDEAFKLLVDQHPSKEQILKKDAGNGSGNDGGAGGAGSGRMIRTADFDKLTPQQQSETAAKAAKGEIQIVD